MAHKAIIIIPSRYASTRFPGKPLALIGAKPMIQHVVEKASATQMRVLVATDDERIADCVRSFGGEVVMTSSKHQSGTDRIIEAYQIAGAGEEIVINLQGDEPFVRVEQIESLISAFDEPFTEIATLAEPFAKDSSNAELYNPNSVKLIQTTDGRAIYFSRSPIPYLRGVEQNWCSHHQYYKHIGLYAFHSSILRELSQLPTGILERAESLEQLRWLEAGYNIQVMASTSATIGIDTPEDLERAEAFYQSMQSS